METFSQWRLPSSVDSSFYPVDIKLVNTATTPHSTVWLSTCSDVPSPSDIASLFSMFYAQSGVYCRIRFLPRFHRRQALLPTWYLWGGIQLLWQLYKAGATGTTRWCLRKFRHLSLEPCIRGHLSISFKEESGFTKSARVGKHPGDASS